MNGHFCGENVIHEPNPVSMYEPMDAVSDFAINVGGVQSGDVVVGIQTGRDVLSPKLRLLGAHCVMLESWPSSLTDPLPMDSRCVDVAFASMVLHNIHFPILAISEMKRILKRRGRLVLIDLAKYDDPSFKEDRHDRWMGFYSSDIRHWLKVSGFSNIIVNPVPGRHLGFSTDGLDKSMGAGILMATATA